MVLVKLMAFGHIMWAVIFSCICLCANLPSGAGFLKEELCMDWQTQMCCIYSWWWQNLRPLGLQKMFWPIICDLGYFFLSKLYQLLGHWGSLQHLYSILFFIIVKQDMNTDWPLQKKHMYPGSIHAIIQSANCMASVKCTKQYRYRSRASVHVCLYSLYKNKKHTMRGQF